MLKKYLLLSLLVSLSIACKANTLPSTITTVSEVSEQPSEAVTTSKQVPDLDPEHPKIEKLSPEQIKEWSVKPIADWVSFFGSEAETWNPFQMKFYEDVKIKALSEEQLEKYKTYTDADWEKEFGGAMDTWKVHDLLFYSAILNLMVN